MACIAFAHCVFAQAPELTLHDAIAAAEKSPQAHTGQDQVDAAHGLVRQAGLRPNPRIYLSSEDIRPGASDFSFPNNTEDYGYLGQLFELDGKRGRRLDLARANERRAESQRLLLEQQIAGRVAAAYWTAVVSGRVVKLLEGDMGSVDKMVRYHKERVDAGAMRGVDLLRMQIERDRLVIALGQAQRDAALTRIDLFRQMGRPVDSKLVLSDSIDTVTPIKTLTLAAVLGARADVAVAREGVSAAQADVKLQRSLAVPDLDLLGGYKRNSGADTIFTSLQFPLAFRNRNQGEVERARASVHLAQDQLQQLELTVGADVLAAQEAYTREQDIVEKTLPEMRSHAEENLAIMSDAYRIGGVDLLRYIDAERTAVDVEVNALRTLAEFQQSALRLQFAYGVRP